MTEYEDIVVEAATPPRPFVAPAPSPSPDEPPASPVDDEYDVMQYDSAMEYESHYDSECE